jgi:hypothetical protein
MIVERQDNGSLLISDTVGNIGLRRFIISILKKKPLNFLENRRKVKKEGNALNYIFGIISESAKIIWNNIRSQEECAHG